MIYTHSHTDHWGGVKGVTNVDDVASGKVPVIAPEGFVEAIAQENVLAGAAMVRRAQISSACCCRKASAGRSMPGLARRCRADR